MRWKERNKMGEHLVTERKYIYRSCRVTKGFLPLEGGIFMNRKKKGEFYLNPMCENDKYGATFQTKELQKP